MFRCVHFRRIFCTPMCGFVVGFNKTVQQRTDLQEAFRMKSKRKGFCASSWFMCVYTLNAAPALSMVLNLQPEPEVCCRQQRPMKEYRLFVIGSVTTVCTQQQMRNRKGGKKCFGGWNVMWTVGFNHWTPQGCYRLPSMLLKARSSFRLGFAVARLERKSHHHLQLQPRG